MEQHSQRPPNDTRIIFMGTPQFAISCLERLLADGYNVVGVFTAPDRPAGRGREPQASPVKRYAVSRGLPVYQPESLRRGDGPETVAGLQPDLIVVAAYGLILSPRVLNMPERGAINVHPSLLPRHRGASPVAGAILAGDRETGVTIFLMDPGMDTGPILSQKAVPLEGNETTGALTEHLFEVGAGLLADTVPMWLSGRIPPMAQDESKATVTRLIRKEDGLIDWSDRAEEIERRVRAYHPWPGAFTIWKGRLLKVLTAWSLPDRVGERPGEVAQAKGLDDGRPAVAVQTGDGSLVLASVQMEGRRAVAAVEFIRGQRDFVGSVLPS